VNPFSGVLEIRAAFSSCGRCGLIVAMLNAGVPAGP
jgi:hypothetical protein